MKTVTAGGLEARLAGWRENVGGAVHLDLAPPPAAGPAAGGDGIVVVSWNVWIGRGRLLELVERHAAGELGVPGELPLVLLIQEALRRDDSVPPRSNGFAARDLARELGARGRPTQDIVEVARRLGWNLRYVPSMRNGGERSDRGNAILTPLPLGPAVAVELPFALQRRVAVGADVSIARWPIRLLSAHLDPRGPVGYKWLGAAARHRQMAHLLAGLEDPTVILGADLNLGRGRSEAAWRLLVEHDFEYGVPAAPPTWRHTYHSLPRLVIDYLLVRNRRGAIRSSLVRRVDEDPRDRGPAVFGSDHHPLLARVEFAP
ncbi:MAG TPA: endonuclease/exonuclease/phosphatase family protein [Gemmatimonadales bacterium]|nr:endonuclease/exonuclease/phosphatase family protein [Gemmatimonadales bacterium]